MQKVVPCASDRSGQANSRLLATPLLDTRAEKDHKHSIMEQDVTCFELDRASELHSQHPIRPEVLCVVMSDFPFEPFAYLQGERATVSLKVGTKLEGELSASENQTVRNNK